MIKLQYLSGRWSLIPAMPWPIPSRMRLPGEEHAPEAVAAVPAVTLSMITIIIYYCLNQSRLETGTSFRVFLTVPVVGAMTATLIR